LQVTMMIKKQNLTKFFAKNKSVNQLIMKLACPMQHRRKYQSKILMKVLKLKSVNSKMSGSPSFRGSFMIPVMTLWIVIFAARQVQIFRLYYFKIWIKKILTLLITVFFGQWVDIFFLNTLASTYSPHQPIQGWS
jgi:hypothetical protein